MRQLIHAASGIANLGFENGADVDGTLSQAEDLLFTLRTSGGLRDFIHIREVLDRFLEESAAATEGSLDEGTAPIPSGFADLDQLLGGLQRSDLLILAARPGLGKTALALSIARNAARYGATSAIFSLEMSRDQLGNRLLAAEADIESYRLRQHLYSDSQERRIIDATGVLSDLPIYIDDTPMLTVMELRSKARRLHMEKKIDLIIVDYLQLMQGPDSRGNANRVQEVSEISRSLKALARDLNVPVLALSQLNRAVENRTSHRPQLSDLRESGSIEQDADVVMFIYREDANYTPEEWEARYYDKPYPKDMAELIISKHRHGAQGSIHLRFEARLAKFESLPDSAGVM
jgi:replicative DNA helicase